MSSLSLLRQAGFLAFIALTLEKMVMVMMEFVKWEKIFAFSLLPSYCFALLGSLSLILIVVAKPRLRKPRHICQVLSLVNSMVGVFFGIYGFFFLYERLAEEGGNLSIKWFYLFIMHRYLLLLGDLMPSLDRCLAVVQPLKYYTHATPSMAVGKTQCTDNTDALLTW